MTDEKDIKEKKDRVFIGEIVYRFGVIGFDENDARTKMYGLKGSTYIKFKDVLQYDRLDFITSYPLVKTDENEVKGS
jgi:hypothetical protein